MYAVIETGGKQYQVKPGDEVFVEKLDVNAEDAVTFDKVMVVGADDGIKVGASGDPLPQRNLHRVYPSGGRRDSGGQKPRSLWRIPAEHAGRTKGLDRFVAFLG